MTLLNICILNGMKRNLEPETYFPLGELPIEAKAVIVHAIRTYDNLDDIINTIEATKLINRQFNSIVKNVYGNYNKLDEFTTLVHLLSDKFPEETTENIAKKFKIPITQKYIELGKKLLILSGTRSAIAFNNTKQAITDGADVNFTTSFIVDPTTGAYHIYTPFLFAAQIQNFALLMLLITSGIKGKTVNTAHATLEKIQEAREAYGLQ